MISAIVPTLNNGPTLAPALSALIPAAVQGILREVIIVDAGSTDQTLKIADGCGAITLEHAGTPSAQCFAAAQSAKFSWLLLMSPNVVLDVGWEREVDQFIHRVETQKSIAQAAVFALGLDAIGWEPRVAERLVRTLTALSGRPHPTQGLLIQRAHFAAINQTRPRCITMRARATLDTSAFVASGPAAWALRQIGSQPTNGWFSRSGPSAPNTSRHQQIASL